MVEPDPATSLATVEDDAGKVLRQPARSAGTLPLIVGSWLVIGYFVLSYVYNIVTYSRNSITGDQWHWLEFVLLPYERGDMSIFDAATFEYSTLGHSHIPTLIVFILNYKLFGLNLTVDRVVGLVALSATLLVVFRHARSHFGHRAALVTTAVCSAILFRGLPASTFTWSLLQFQLLYTLVAFLYLRSFLSNYTTRPLAHALIAIPATLLLGDAIGVAAVVASLVYLGLLTVSKRVRPRVMLQYVALFAAEIFALSKLIHGQRVLVNPSLGDFAKFLVDEPRQVIDASSYALATIFVGLGGETNVPLTEWHNARWWFLLTVVVVAAAIFLIWRTGLKKRDHFPILIILTGLVWVGGVFKARVSLLGPEVGMQVPRYAMITGIVGVGIILLLAPRIKDAGRGGWILLVFGALVVVANGYASFHVSQDDEVAAQKADIAQVRAYVFDEVYDYRVGFRCSAVPCLRASWFMFDENLAVFNSEDGPRFAWEEDLRYEIYKPFPTMTVDEIFGACDIVIASNDDAVATWAFSDAGLALDSTLTRERIQIPEPERAFAERTVVRALRTTCGQSTKPNN